MTRQDELRAMVAAASEYGWDAKACPCGDPRCKRWMVDVLPGSEADAKLAAAAPSLATDLADAMDDVARLREALESIAEGDVPRPVASAWRDDGKPSKHDYCPHNTAMYMDCPDCIADFARAALEARHD